MSEEILKIRKSTLDAIGDAIRTKTGKNALINPSLMPDEIKSISGGVLSEKAYYGTSYPTSANQGDIFFNPSTSLFYIYKNNGWVEMTKTLLNYIVFPSTLNWQQLSSSERMRISAVSSTQIKIQSEWYNNSNSAFVISSDTVDLTGYTKLSITFSITGLGAYSDCYNYWRIGINENQNSSSNTYVQKQITGANAGNITYTVDMDITNYNKEYYIYFGGLETHSNALCTVQNIELM